MKYRIEWTDEKGTKREVVSRHFHMLLEYKRQLTAAGFAVLFLRA